MIKSYAFSFQIFAYDSWKLWFLKSNDLFRNSKAPRKGFVNHGLKNKDRNVFMKNGEYMKTNSSFRKIVITHFKWRTSNWMYGVKWLSRPGLGKVFSEFRCCCYCCCCCFFAFALLLSCFSYLAFLLSFNFQAISFFSIHFSTLLFLYLPFVT